MARLSTRKIACIVIALAVLAIAGYRAFVAMIHPIGTGETRKSPDGKREAEAMMMFDESFFGRQRTTYVFSISGGAEVQRLVTDPLPGPYFGSRSSHSVIRWAADSKSVRFVFDGVEIVMKVRDDSAR